MTDFPHIYDPILGDRLQKRLDKRASSLAGWSLFRPHIWQSALIQRRVVPKIKKPTALILAADHGMAGSLQSANLYQASHAHFLQWMDGEGSPVESARQQRIHLHLADCGLYYPVDTHLSYWMKKGSGFEDFKLGDGTADLLHKPAMTTEQFESAWEVGQKLVNSLKASGCNLLLLATYGAGSDFSALASTAALYDISAAEASVKLGIQVDVAMADQLDRIVRQNPKSRDYQTNLTFFSGFEQICAISVLQACAAQQIAVVVDESARFAQLAAVLDNSVVVDFCLQGKKPFALRPLQWINHFPLAGTWPRYAEYKQAIQLWTSLNH